MIQTNKIAVLGGSGKAGQYLIKQLLRHNYDIKALVRNPERFPFHHRSIEVIIGDATDGTSIKALVDGCGAVISSLGMGVPPGSPTIFSLATSNILEAMRASKSNVISHYRIKCRHSSRSQKYWHKTGNGVDVRPLSKSTADRQLEYDMLSRSPFDWTLVRLPRIEQTDRRDEISVSLEDCPRDRISATSLALFLLRQIEDKTYCRKAPFIANR
jgi:hypothetical protein